MTGPARLAGWGSGGDGSVVTWTVSEGRKGRRWREVISRGAAVDHALLLETGPDDRFSHLELARADGLWTFHPEGDGTLHGNHVGRSEAGVRHIAGWRFDADDVLIVEGSLLSLAAVAFERRASVAIGLSVEVGAVVIGAAAGALRRDDALRIEHVSDGRWQVGGWPAIEIEADGSPVLADGQRRPLELA